MNLSNTSQNPKLIAFEHSTSSHSISSSPTNIVLFIGGLGDSILTVPYPSLLATRLPPSWSLAEIFLSSSLKGYGTSSIVQDADEIAECVRYFREHQGKEKVVLMGHSTGCQDVMEYLVGRAGKREKVNGGTRVERPNVEGGILQASVSDREGAWKSIDANTQSRDAFEQLMKMAREFASDGRADEVLPMKASGEFQCGAITARRWLALNEVKGDDDYFSSDFERSFVEKETFGRIPRGTKMCILYSGEDESVPDFVDKEKLVESWIEVIKESETGPEGIDQKYSGVVKGASHSLEEEGQEEAVEDLFRRVLGFIDGL